LSDSLRFYKGFQLRRLPVYLKLFKYLKLSCLLLIPVTLYCQENALTDSLEQALESKSGIDRFEILYALSFEHVPQNKDRALECADELISVAYLSGDSVKIVKSLLSRGFVLRNSERLDEAIPYFQRALNIAQRNNFNKETAYILNSLALIYTSNDNYDKALEYNYKSLVVRETHGTPHDIAVTLNNLGWLYFRLNNYEEALKFYQRSLNIKRENDIYYDLDILLVNIGSCYYQLGDGNAARQYVREGLTVCSDQCLPERRVDAYLVLGLSYRDERPDSAEYYFTKSLLISKQIDQLRYQIENYSRLAEISILRKEYNSAKLFLDSAQSIADHTEYDRLVMDIYSIYAKLYIEIGDFEKASGYQNKYIQLNDSLISSRIRNIVNIETNYRERENIQTIAAKEHIIRRQQSLSIAIIIIAILVASLTFVLYRSNRIKKRVNAALSEAKAIIEDQNRQLLNSNIHLDKELKERNVDLERANESLRKVNDELDNFIYKTSHDIRGPLASLKGMCNVAILDVTDPVALAYLRKLDVTAEKLNSILTRLLIVNQINNSAISTVNIDFPQIINDVLLLEKKKGIPQRLVVNKHVALDVEFYSDKEFIRIILENLIDNAIKFYNKSERVIPFVKISINLENEHVVIRVTDNGIGIHQTQPDKIFQIFSRESERSESGGIGLYITKTAVQKLGGAIDFRTTSDGHTEFSVMLPLTTSGVMV
jgi:signal transduction histidine kinase